MVPAALAQTIDRAPRSLRVRLPCSTSGCSAVGGGVVRVLPRGGAGGKGLGGARGARVQERARLAAAARCGGDPVVEKGAQREVARGAGRRGGGGVVRRVRAGDDAPISP